MSEFLIRNPQGFPFGFTAITKITDSEHNTGFNFGILRLKSGEEIKIHRNFESVYLLIQGMCTFIHDEIVKTVERHSCFTDEPQAIHFSANQFIRIKAIADCEFAIAEVDNPATFATQIFDGSNVLESHSDAHHKNMRIIFDKQNRPESKLVLGEVINAQGQKSNYPPHHYPQPELYHYRFLDPDGYGFAESHEGVFKIKQFDTYKILDYKNHTQTAADDHEMYYLWIVRAPDEVKKIKIY